MKKKLLVGLGLVAVSTVTVLVCSKKRKGSDVEFTEEETEEVPELIEAEETVVEEEVVETVVEEVVTDVQVEEQPEVVETKEVEVKEDVSEAKANFMAGMSTMDSQYRSIIIPRIISIFDKLPDVIDCDEIDEIDEAFEKLNQEYFEGDLEMNEYKKGLRKITKSIDALIERQQEERKESEVDGEQPKE